METEVIMEAALEVEEIPHDGTIYIYRERRKKRGEGGLVCYVRFLHHVATRLKDIFGGLSGAPIKVPVKVDLLDSAIVLRPLVALPASEQIIAFRRQMAQLEKEIAEIGEEAERVLGFRPTRVVQRVLERLVNEQDFARAYEKEVENLALAFARLNYVPKPEDFADPAAVERMKRLARRIEDRKTRQTILDLVEVLARARTKEDAETLLCTVAAFVMAIRERRQKLAHLEKKIRDVALKSGLLKGVNEEWKTAENTGASR